MLFSNQVSVTHPPPCSDSLLCESCGLGVGSGPPFPSPSEGVVGVGWDEKRDVRSSPPSCGCGWVGSYKSRNYLGHLSTYTIWYEDDRKYLHGRLLPPPAGKVLPCWGILAADYVWCTHHGSLPVVLWFGPTRFKDGMEDWWAHYWHFSLWPCSRTHHHLACALWRLRGYWGVRGCILELACLRCLEL